MTIEENIVGFDDMCKPYIVNYTVWWDINTFFLRY
jgi:hypothetical protein